MAGLTQEIKTRCNAFMAAFVSKDSSACSEFYTPDCKFMPHGRDIISGKGGVKAYFQQDMDEGVASVTLNSEEVNGAGDWAFERGNYRLDGTRGTETGCYLIIWKKLSGVWYMYTDCFNVVNPAQG